MLRAWVFGHPGAADGESVEPLTAADGLRAARLAALAEHAEQACKRAMARNNWAAAAHYEEARVVRQHELAELLLEFQAPRMRRASCH